MFDMSDDNNADCVESNSEELRDLARLAGKEAEEWACYETDHALQQTNTLADVGCCCVEAATQ